MPAASSNDNNDKNSKKKRSPGFLGNAYLFLYNIACAAGWFYVLVFSIRHIMNNSWESQLYGDVEVVLKVVQTAALLEIVHAMTGLVRSPWITVVMQVSSRIWTLWAIMHLFDSTQSSVFFLLAATSWALVEVPRYLFYAASIINLVPYPLFWLRYSLFAILYPTGITGELGCMYYALIQLYGNSKSPVDLPADKLALLVLIAVVILSYIPGSPTMYGHMLKTRNKQFKELKAAGAEKSK